MKMRKQTRIRGSLGALLILVALSIALIAPAATHAAPSGTYSASSSATLLNLQLLAATSQPTIKIATVSSENNSNPLSAKASATGLFCAGTGECQTFINNSTQNASAPADATPGQKCHSGSILPGDLADLLTVSQACGDASAKTSTGDPIGQATAQASSVQASLNLVNLFPEGDEALDTLTKQVADLLAPVIAAAPEQLQTILKSVFSTVNGDRKVLEIKIGAAKSSALSEGATVSGLATTPVLEVGLLPICELGGQPLAETCNATQAAALSPLTHGLLKISITGGSAEAKYLGATGKGSAVATPATANIQVRNLDQAGNIYTTLANIPISAPPVTLPLPAPLTTTLSVGTPKTSQGDALPATASVSALEIHALQGLKESAAGPDPGGILFQVGAVEARADGKIPTTVLSLPKTGGMRYVFFALAAILAVGAPAIYIISRRIRRSA
jgi:LPXTG-motif cell wall-anchored protein